jgi:hypothetical protein
MYLTIYLDKNNFFFFPHSTVYVYYVPTNKIYGAATVIIIVLVSA